MNEIRLSADKSKLFAAGVGNELRPAFASAPEPVAIQYAEGLAA